MLEKLVKHRNLMTVWDATAGDWKSRRRETVDQLCREEYGFMPKEYDRLTWTEENAPFTFCAGRAEHKKVTLTAHFGEGSFSFPIYKSTTQKAGKME
ncbi:MAG: hypothetical protein K5663_12665 [Clostridiales bacterium]|nr:hypothetical protein [Clostridiales bacterium]